MVLKIVLACFGRIPLTKNLRKHCFCHSPTEVARIVAQNSKNLQLCNHTLSWKCRFFRCRPQLVLKTFLCVFPTRPPDTADVSATSCDVGFFFSVLYVVSLPNCRHVVVRSNYSLKLSSSRKCTRVLVT